MSGFSASPVDVSLNISELPSDVAGMVERAQVEDPETLRRIIIYGMTRLTVFEELLARDWAPRRAVGE